MNLWEELKRIDKISGKTKIKVVLLDESVLVGFYDGYTSSLDNDPPIASIDVRTEDGLYELYENEIRSIETA